MARRALPRMEDGPPDCAPSTPDCAPDCRARLARRVWLGGSGRTLTLGGHASGPQSGNSWPQGCGQVRERADSLWAKNVPSSGRRQRGPQRIETSDNAREVLGTGLRAELMAPSRRRGRAMRPVIVGLRWGGRRSQCPWRGRRFVFDACNIVAHGSSTFSRVWRVRIMYPSELSCFSLSLPQFMSLKLVTWPEARILALPLPTGHSS